MPRDPDAPGDGAMFAQIFTPSLGTSGRVNSPSFNSRVLLLMPTVRTPPNSGAGFKSEYGVKVVDEFFDIWPVLFKHQSRRRCGSISGNRAVPLSVGMGGCERHAFFLKRVHLPINY